MTPTKKAARPGRLRRWLRHFRRLLTALVVLVVVVVVAALVALANLDYPPIRARISRLVAGVSGLALDYDIGSAGLRRVSFGAIRVAQPGAFAGGPHLVEVDHIDGSWSLLPLAVGGDARVHELTVKGVRIVVLVDAKGRTSFDMLPPAPPSAAPSTPEKPTPLSALLANLLPRGVAVEKVRLEDVSFELVRLDGERLAAVGGLSLMASLDDKGLEATLSPTVVAVTPELANRQHAPGGFVVALLGAHARLAHDGGLTATVTLERRAAAGLPAAHKNAGPLLSLEIDAKRDGETLRAHVSTPDGALEGAVSFDAQASVRGDAVIVDKLALSVDEAAGPWLARLAPSLKLESPRVRARMAGVDLAAATLDDGGELSIDLRAAGVRHGAITVDGFELKARGKNPPNQPMSIDVDATVAAASLAAARMVSSVQLAIELEPQRVWPPGPTKFHGRIGFARAVFDEDDLTGAGLDVRGAATFAPLAFADLRVALDAASAHYEGLGVDTLHLTARAPRVAPDGLHTRGRVDVGGTVGAVRGVGLDASGIGVKLAADFAAREAADVTVELPIGKLRIAPLPPTPAKLALRSDKLALTSPLRLSTGHAAIDVAFGALVLHGTLDKRPTEADFDVNGELADAAQLEALATSWPYRLPWSSLKLSLASKGKLTGLGRDAAARIDDTITFDVDGLELIPRKDNRAPLGAKKIHGVTVVRGGGRSGFVDAQLAISGAHLGDRQATAERVSLRADVDLDGPRASLRWAGSGGVTPAADVNLDVVYDRPTHGLSWKIQSKLAQAGIVEVLAPSLAAQLPLAWDDFDVAADSRGSLAGLIAAWPSGAMPSLTKNFAGMRGEHQTHLVVHNLSWDGETLVAEIPDATFDSTGRLDGSNAIADVSGLIAAADAQLGEHRLSARAVSPTVHVEAGADLADLRVVFAAKAAAISQDFAPEYRIGDLTAEARLGGDPRGSLTIERVLFDNPGGGSHAELAGGFERDAGGHMLLLGRRGLSLSGHIEQKLAALGVGSGTIKLPFTVESGDSALYHVRAAVEATDVSVELTSSHIAVSGLRARVPIVEDVFVDDGGFVFGDGDDSAYTRLRFADQHPFLGSNHFLVLDKLRVGDTTVGPLAGNLRIDKNVAALDQLELSAFGGHITGQCIVDLRAEEPVVTVRGDATGLRPAGRGEAERFDGSAALTLKPTRLGVEGRAEIARISRLDLLRLLDAVDPYRADVALNRVRKALEIGYPKKVRLKFHEGFASAGVELGGLGALVQLGQLQGLPIGPLMERYVAPLFRRGEP